MTTATPRTRRRARTRQEILRAALQLVTERGLAALSMRELAARIDYSPSAIYEYFASKEALLAALRAEGFARLAARLAAVPGVLPPAERLRALNLAYLDFAAEHPEHYLLMFSRGLNESATPKSFTADPAYALLQACVREGIAAGVFTRGVDDGGEALCYTCWATVHGLAMLDLAHLHRTREALAPLARRAVGLLVEGFQGG